MRTFPLLLACLALAACGKSDPPASSAGGASTAPAASGSADASGVADASGLTPDELEHGIGPAQEVAITDAIDPALVASGETIFNQKCSACHKMDERYVGPPLRDVTTRRSPRFVMNQMLNPAEMAQRHPEGKKLLAEYLTQMPDQQLSQDDARALLEYLRKAASETPAAPAS